MNQKIKRMRVALAVVLTLLSMYTANAGWRDWFGCHEEIANPCEECSPDDLESTWPQFAEQLGASWNQYLKEDARLNYWYDLKSGELDAKSNYAIATGNSEAASKIMNAEFELTDLWIEKTFLLIEADTNRCKRLFPDRYSSRTLE